MKLKYKIWFILTSINVTFIVGLLIYFLVLTTMFTIANIKGNTSFPWFSVIPYAVFISLGLFPIFYSLLLGFKKLIKKDTFLKARKQILWLNISCLAYIRTVLLVFVIFFIAGWDMYPMGLSNKEAFLIYLLAILIGSIHPFYAFLTFIKE